MAVTAVSVKGEVSGVGSGRDAVEGGGEQDVAPDRPVCGLRGVLSSETLISPDRVSCRQRRLPVARGHRPSAPLPLPQAFPESSLHAHWKGCT